MAEGKADQFILGTSRNFILRGTFNDGFQVAVQVCPFLFFEFIDNRSVLFAI